MTRLFGTDGIRGTVNSFPMDANSILRIGQIIANVLQEQSHHFHAKKTRIVIGKDTRGSCKMYENALSAGICSQNADAVLLGVLPSPAIAFATTSLQADAGIMISASHNSNKDNGIKIFSSDGFKLSDGIEREIENRFFETKEKFYHPTDPNPSLDFGRESSVSGFEKAYAVLLKSALPLHFHLKGIKIALDCANGAAHKFAPSFLSRLHADVFSIGIYPNGVNINHQIGSLFPEQVSALTTDKNAHIGIALDGDADRCILSDELGNILNGDEILGIFALSYAHKNKLPHKTAVTTVMSNMGLEQSLKKQGVHLIKTPVGDRFVASAMKNFGFSLGGEPSGHFIFLDHETSCDGLLCAIKMIEIMKETQKPLSELRKQIKLWPQVLESINVLQKPPLDQLPQVTKAIQETESSLQNRGRVFVRYSGTEPVARVLIEGEDLLEIKRLSQNLIFSLQKELNSYVEVPLLSA